MTKKNAYLITLLTLLFVLCLTAGIYFLLKPKNSETTSYNVNKYEDLVNWCNTNTEENKLNVNCNALLLEIRTIDTNDSCADIQVITKGKELKSISICESGSVLAYSNEVLAYKRLMPINLALTYSRDSVVSSYTLNTISAVKLEEAYIQGIVNEDISNLATIDPTSTTIQNSVDFCPSPTLLPGYISENNKAKYNEYYKNNILSESKYTEILDEEFKSVFIDNWKKPTIKILFGCESASRLGYSSLCKTTLGSEYKNLELSTIPTSVSNWEIKTNTDSDLISLKNISLALDGMQYNRSHANYAAPIVLTNLFKFVYDANNNQNVFCSQYKIHEKLAQYLTDSAAQLNGIRTSVITNILKASPICLDILDRNLYSREGIYLESLQTKDSSGLEIYQRCNNLYLLMSNE